MKTLLDVEGCDAYLLRARFDDGTTHEIGVSTELYGPVFEPLHDPSYFKLGRSDPGAGTIVWPNGADLAPELFEGEASGTEPQGNEATTSR